MAAVAGTGKLFSTVIIIPLKVNIPHQCSTVDGLSGILKSPNKQNANGC